MMNIYEVITFVVFLFMLYVWRTGKNNSRLFLIGAFLIFFMEALRAIHVGGDTLNYTAFFMGEFNGYGYLYDDLNNLAIEPGYVLINRLFAYVLQQEWWFIFISSCIIMLPILYRIYKYNLGNKLMSLCMFMTMWGLLACSVTSLRQNFGITFLLVGIYLISNRPKKKKYLWYLAILGCGIMALSCHSSIYLTMPLLVAIYFIPMNRKIAIISLAFCMVVPVLVDNFFGTVVNYLATFTRGFEFLDRSMNYSGDMLTGGEFGLKKVSIFAVAPYAIFVASFVMLYTKKELKKYETKCLIVGQCLYMLGLSFPMVVRAVLGVTIVGMVAVPVAFSNKSAKGIYTIVPIVMMAYYIYEMFLTFSTWNYSTGGGGSKLLPYEFIWE